MVANNIENKICVCLGNLSFDDCLAAVKKYPFCEIRLDLLNLSISEIKTLFESGKKNYCNLPKWEILEFSETRISYTSHKIGCYLCRFRI